jgi:hypothetical protein
MPTKLFNISANKQTKLDVRPDRPDIRDRPYMPPLRSLPPAYPPTDWITDYFPQYRIAGLVLNQGTEGACTGFGLAAVVNYLLFSQCMIVAEEVGTKPVFPEPVSSRMLYHLARLYDEWPGEDYDGSSCRGAIKGWFHHGVCAENFWPYKAPGSKVPKFVSPTPGWDSDAAKRPVGAYYRIARESIADMQAALHEVGAVYVSADVHDGWRLNSLKAAPNATLSLANLPTINWTDDLGKVGGHAFALVGYDVDGFIVQNSWGDNWGFQGFARLTYADWVANGSDAWVAVMGAPIRGRAPSVILSSSRTVSDLTPALGRGLANGATAHAVETAPTSRMLDANTISKHVVVLGNGGRPVQIRLDASSATNAVRDVGYTWPKQHFDKLGATKPKRIAIYMHGGLNDLSAGLARAKVMAPAFLDNEVYPIFVIWQSGVIDAIKDILGLTFDQELRPNKNIFKDIFDRTRDVVDSGLELSTMVAGTGIWDALKNRAIGASEAEGGVRSLIASLAELKKDYPGLEIHAAAHSAGAIMLGASFSPMILKKLTYSTIALYAPACTVEFANETYLAKAGKAFYPANVRIDLLSHKNENDDTVGPYGKSLLFYVSRACERRKTPILGLEGVWDATFDKDDLFRDSNGGVNPDIARWRKGSAAMTLKILTAPSIVVNTNTGATIGAVHGCFDNWVEGVSETIKRMRGGPLKSPITSLEGF